MADVVRIELDKVRKLKVRHQYLREAREVTNKSIHELVQDPFGGYPYLLRALLQPTDQTITLNRASELIDLWCDRGKKLDDLGQHLVRALADYLHIEMTPTDDEEEDAAKAGTAVPNADSPAAPGPSAD
jgi:hypothetical protein